ncbi:uncharacterized protein LOC106167289 [Lingula anatina]|uniref:Uncharacterized protein LOC106167289 n=1 Tax=Lingula anatina TaxID=7574 RepID=A0A1S3ITR8_LINAN|nr:uncharacterized protein LOC106167289 [Lingula anatina]|eukprot:XP_013401478.1 uncharacterized protein LOC106167289 [Lingula anatina]
MTSTSSVDLTIGGSRIGTQSWHGKGTLVPEAPLSMSAVLLYMWKEMMYVEVSTGNTWRARGQVSAPSKAACTASKTVLCQVSEVTVDGQASDRLKKVLDTNGLAAVHYDALAKTLNMSVLVFDARQDENVTGVQVTSGSSQLCSAGGELFAPSLLQDKGFMLKDHTMEVALDDDNIAALQRGEVKVKVMTSRYPDGIYGNIPSLSQMPQPSTANPRSTRGPISRGSHTTTGAPVIMTALLVLAKII